MKTVNINIEFVQSAPAPTDKDQVFYRDAKLKGFALRVTSNGVKSFVVEKVINRKVRRITIGKYSNALPPQKARKKAEILIGKISDGGDPVAEKRVAQIKGITLNEVFDDFLKARKSLKPKTVYDYNRVLNVAFDKWQKKSLTSISEDQIAKHHESLGQERGEAYANLSMRVLRALFNFAINKYKTPQGQRIIIENPVKSLSHDRAWYRIQRRDTYIKPHQLSAWYEAVKNLQNDTLRDYLLLTLFTGLRRQEAAKLTWDQIDLKDKTLNLPFKTAKNWMPLVLPLSDFLTDLLAQRNKVKTSEYVFPGSGLSGHIVEPRKQTAKVIEITGIRFTIHDLRRTFITVAESLDISSYSLKRLLNHKQNSGDVTEGYIILDVERLRKPMQLIADHLLRHMESKEASKAILLHSLNIAQ